MASDGYDLIEGYQIDFPDDRHVFVSEHEDGFLIRFRNKKGKETWLALSKEAGDALRYLLGGKDLKPEETVQKFLAHMMTVTSKTESKLAWQVIETDVVTEQPATNP